jgi:adenylate cyclase
LEPEASVAQARAGDAGSMSETGSAPDALPYLPPSVQPLRVLVWFLHVALPLVGLWALLARPSADLVWQHNVAHFWLVVVVAAVNLVLGLAIVAAARRHRDARLLLVCMAFLASAGFLLLHALATPGVVVGHPSAGFDLAQPVGLTVASVFAVASSANLGGRIARAVLRGQLALVLGLAGLMAGWGVISLADLPPLNAPARARDVAGPLSVVAIVAVVLYVVAAVRYYLLHRRQRSAVLLSVITAFVLLAEAMVAVLLAQKWHLSWWEWHALLAFAFGFVGYSAYVQYRREGSSAGLFDAVTLAATAHRIRNEYGAALADLVAALEERARTGHSGTRPLADRLAQRFDLSEGQTAVLERAGAALAAERGRSRRLAALASVGERARVGLDDEDLLHDVLDLVRPGYGEVHAGLVSAGVVTVAGHAYQVADLAAGTGAASRPGRVAFPLTVKGNVAGVLEVPEPHGESAAEERALLATLAHQLSISLENARLYRELGTLFRQYLSPDVAAALLADPDQAALGGSVVEVTALFADLRGFTTFSEAVDPPEIVRMLNRYHAVAVPSILDNGGTVVQFIGDAILALFNAPARQRDHALRAVRAALQMQAAVATIADGEPGWPRFRVGANTGPALVGNIGSEALRGFNAMGDAVNVAARLQSLAEPGQIVIGEATRLELGDRVRLRPLGDLAVKGRHQAARAYVVLGLSEPDGAGVAPRSEPGGAGDVAPGGADR